MDIVVGEVVEGKVSKITEFGAFVSVGPGKSGLVHISEIAGEFINNVRDHLTEGQTVTVKVIGFDKSGRLNLSIKQAAAGFQPPQQRPPQNRRGNPGKKAAAAEPTFEDKLKRFMQDSDSKMSGISQYSHQKGTRKRR
jgi:S1 RNA binding domain protein